MAWGIRYESASRKMRAYFPGLDGEVKGEIYRDERSPRSDMLFDHQMPWVKCYVPALVPEAPAFSIAVPFGDQIDVHYPDGTELGTLVEGFVRHNDAVVARVTSVKRAQPNFPAAAMYKVSFDIIGGISNHPFRRVAVELWRHPHDQNPDAIRAARQILQNYSALKSFGSKASFLQDLARC